MSNYDKKVDEFIHEGIKEIDQEIKEEYDIRDQAEYVARMLALNPIVKVTVNDRIYNLIMKMHKIPDVGQIITLLAEDDGKKSIYGNRYTPAIYHAEFNDEFTLEENCQTLVSAFIGNVSGKLKIETLQDEGSVKVAREKDIIKK